MREIIHIHETYTPPAELQQRARERIGEKQAEMKIRYDASRATDERYNVGDIVFIRVAPVGTGESTK